MQVKTDAHDHMFMELIDSKIMPFNLSTSTAAVWKLVALPRTKLHNGYYEVRSNGYEWKRNPGFHISFSGSNNVCNS